MFKRIKRLFCKHEYLPYANVFGDHINYMNCRTVLLCPKCGKRKYVGDFIEAPFNYNELMMYIHIAEHDGEETAEKICGDFIVRDRELLHKFFEDCQEIERRSKKE